MKKTFITLFVFLLTAPAVNAQFVGYYNMRDGGVDMPSSALCILPKNEFVLFYYAGYKTGTWQLIDSSSIRLSENKTDINPIKIYAKVRTENSDISLDVYGLFKSSASISFSNDTNSQHDFQPIFNYFPNCQGDDYLIKKKKGIYKYVTITLPADPNFGMNEIEYPYNAISYAFPLSAKYNQYTVLHFDDAFKENIGITISKQDSNYTLEDGKEIIYNELTDIILAKIEQGKKAVDNENSTARFGQPIGFLSKRNIRLAKSKLDPIFVVKCDPVERESTALEATQETPIATDRSDGFYTITNEELPNNLKNYELAKKPSLGKEDILSVKKVVAETDQYELEITFTEAGAKKFEKLSSLNINKPITIVLNGFIIAAPKVESGISGSKISISGGLTEQFVDQAVADFTK